MDDRAIGRAAFLGLLGTGIAGLFFARDVTGFVGRIMPDGPAFIPGSGSWRIYTIGNGIRRIDPAAYRLRIDGAVERPVTLTLAEIERLPVARQVSDFHCVTGWSVTNVRWRGVRFADLLDLAGPTPGARSLRFVSDEPRYDDSLTLAQAALPDAMLALEMDDKPLSQAHGGPARVVMPQMYGYKSVKWVTHIEVREDVVPGYWEQNGYDADAWIGRSNGL